MLNYGFASEVPMDDPRQLAWSQQREERGFDDTELWNLDKTIAKFIHPRLVAFAETSAGHPGNLESTEEWEAILKTMTDAFALLADDDMIISSEQHLVISAGLDNFRKYYLTLWD